jgi:predicted metal-dependent hydrolase
MNTTAIRSTPFDLEVRKDTRFNFTGLGDAIHTEANLYTSHFFNALSLMTPITEGILIRAIRECQPLLAGTGLETDAKAFIGQEAIHTREHRELNRQLSALGFDTQEVIDDIEAEVEQLEKSLSLQERLAVVVTGEHVIYSVARALLTSDYCDTEQQEEVKRLFLWHALEEMEHQSVCDDIYRHLYGTGIKHKLVYFRIFLLASKLLLGMVSKLFKALLAQSRAYQKGELKSFLSWLILNPGVGSITAKELLAFFIPGFAHWKRSEEDQSLINQNLMAVYGSTEA